MVDMMRRAKFELGNVVITATAAREVPPDEVRRALARHSAGDWGDVDAHDRKANDDALANGDRLLSVYQTRAGVRFYVITEWDRSVTTLLLPDEY